MPLPKRKLPEGFEEPSLDGSGSLGKVLCRPCSESSPSGDVTLARGSISRHLTSENHIKAIARQEKQRAAKERASLVQQARDVSITTLCATEDLLHLNERGGRLQNDYMAHEWPEPALEGVSVEGSALFNGDGSQIMLTTGRRLSEGERDHIMADMDSLRFISGVGAPLVGAGAVGKAPEVDGVEWSDEEDLDGSSPANDRTVRIIGGLLAAIGLDHGVDASGSESDSDVDEEEGGAHTDTASCTEPEPGLPWYPYPNKLTFLLATLMNKPRVRLSTSQLKEILWLLHELGHDVPSLKGFQLVQKQVRSLVNVPTVDKRTPTGKIFFRNRIPDLIRLDWCNPKTRRYIEEYPVRSEVISEAYQSRKRTTIVHPEAAAPMWALGGKHFYVGELAQLSNGCFVVPRAWYRRISGGEVYAEAWEVDYDRTTGVFVIHDCQTIEISTQHLVANIYDVVDGDVETYGCIRFAGQVPAGIYLGLNPLRRIAQGRRMYTSFIKLWGDDVSGNQSKQYNAHTNVYFTHANLPHEQLAQQYHIKFSSTSQFASAGEQFDAAVADITGDDTWHVAYDCAIGEEILFRVLPEVLPADNPQQSASCSHVGLHGNYPCRRCQFGGTERERETDEGYEQHFSPGKPRTAAETLQAIHQQLEAAALGVANTVSQLQTASGVKDSLAEYWIQQLISLAREKQQIHIKNPSTRDPRLNGRRVPNRNTIVADIEHEIQEELMRWLLTQPHDDFDSLPPDSALRFQLRPGVHFSSLLTVDGLDVHRDTPVELLHTYLLGVQKYTWYHLHQRWSDKQSDTFATRLQASSLHGLTLPSLRANWMVQHSNNLIGKHLKALQQLTIFHLDKGLCDDLAFDLCRATGELGALLWFHEIEDLNEYKRVFVKLKLHILLHILEDAETHGPGIHNATEGFESNNAVFRASSILSNNLAPSRDIAQTSAIMESHKHVMSGGWWKANGTYTRAGVKVRHYSMDARIEKQMGLDSTNDMPGTVRCLQKTRKNGALLWASMHIPSNNSMSPTPSHHPAPDTLWYPCELVVSRNGDRCKIGSWVLASYGGSTVVGRITRIVTPAAAETPGPPDSGSARVILKQYGILNSRHPRFGMPELRREAEDDSCTVALATDILFIVNVQHNCWDSGCTASGRCAVRQERRDTHIMQPTILHKDDDRYLINTHALHNAALLRKALPRHLTKPIPYLQEREEEHRRVAAVLRLTHDARRKRDAEARKVRKAKMDARNDGPTTNGAVDATTSASE